MTQKKDARGNVKLPIGLHKSLSHYAVDEGISLAAVVERAWECLQAGPIAIPKPGDGARAPQYVSAMVGRFRETIKALEKAVAELQALEAGEPTKKKAG